MRHALSGRDPWPPVPVAGHFDLADGGRRDPEDGSSVHGAVVAVARRWCVDRALRPWTLMTVASLMSEAVSYGLRHGAQGLDLSIRWVDLDRVRLELAWRGCGARPMTADPVGQASVPLFDRLADAWGVEAAADGEAWQWFDVDTRRPRGPDRPAVADE